MRKAATSNKPKLVQMFKTQNPKEIAWIIVLFIYNCYEFKDAVLYVILLNHAYNHKIEDIFEIMSFGIYDSPNFEL